MLDDEEIIRSYLALYDIIRIDGNLRYILK